MFSVPSILRPLLSEHAPSQISKPCLSVGQVLFEFRSGTGAIMTIFCYSAVGPTHPATAAPPNNEHVPLVCMGCSPFSALQKR
jgi:hypothetical protein